MQQEIAATQLEERRRPTNIALKMESTAQSWLAGPISRRGLLISLASLFPAGRLLRGQQGEGAPQATFSSDTNVVSVLATVRNKQGQIVRNLTKDDFTLEEDGRPQTIRYFSQESNLPLTLGLLVDTSMSQRRVLGQERTASYAFLDRMLHDKDLAFVIHFDHEVELLQDLTSVRKDLESAMDKLETPERPQWAGRGSSGGGGYPGGGGGYPGGGGGYPGQRGGRRGAGTTLYDSVFLATDELMKKQQGRKAVIILSDGVDMGSKTTLDSAIASAQRSDTLVYSILFADEQAYGSPGGFGRMGGMGGGMGRRGGMGRSRYPSQQPHADGKKILERLSKETGGAMFEVSKKQSVEQIYDRIEEELRNQYNLGYTPDGAAGSGYRKIHVAAKQKGLNVQARDGYYAKQ